MGAIIGYRFKGGNHAIPVNCSEYNSCIEDGLSAEACKCLCARKEIPEYRMQETSWPVELCPGPDNKGCGVAQRRLKGPGPQLLREEAAIAA